MNEQEFNQWGEDFFSRYPSVNEWLKRSSPDPKRTLQYWRETLEPFSLEECTLVLEDWAHDGTEAFEAYERDKIPIAVRQTVLANRQKERDREKVELERYYRDLGRLKKGGPPAIGSTLERAGVAEPLKRLVPLWAKVLDGSLPKHEYEMIKDQILDAGC